MKKIGFFILLFLFVFNYEIYSSEVNEHGRLDKNKLDFISRYQKAIVNVTSVNLLEEITSPLLNIKGTGTGFIYKNTNYVITSTNSINDINSIEITLYDGQKWPARLVGMDYETGIAVIEILSQSKDIIPVVPLVFLPVNEVRTGISVYMLGNPIGKGTNFSTGNVVAPPRIMKNQKGDFLDDIIEVNMVFPASWSGAPVFETSGKVIGIYSNLFDWMGAYKYSGYLLSEETVNFISELLIAKGFVKRPWLGVKLIPLNAYLANILSVSINEGAIITEIHKNSPSFFAGLRGPEREMKIGNRSIPVGSDIIVAIDGEIVDSDKAVQKILLKKGVGSEVLLSVYRDKQIHKIKVKLEEKK